MHIALLQCNTTVGAMQTNAALILERASEAVSRGAGFVLSPEMAVSGYPARDLIEQEGFIDACADAVRSLASQWSHDAPLVVGTPWRVEGGVANALVVCRGGVVEAVYAKRLLPTYDVFDEARHFVKGAQSVVVEAEGVRIGLAICEDLWRGADIVDASGGDGRYAGEPVPVDELMRNSVDVIAVASASPFTHDKLGDQRTILREVSEKHRVVVASANMVGGNDDLVFPGASAVFAPGGALIGSGGIFEEDTVFCDIASSDALEDPLDGMGHEELIYKALVMGIRDYCAKSGITRCVLGVSGGIDSAVVAALATRALGAEHVTGLAMPSRHSSDHSVDDARDLCARLGMPYQLVPIEKMHGAADETLGPLYAALGLSTEPGVAEENVQSRARGLTVMAVANKSNAIALATGNKSELSVGYCTLYGDMNGGLAPISDLLKQDVYRLARWMNDHHDRAGFDGAPIPERTITKPPSAELSPGQLDSDSLPAYDVLDEILHRYVEQRQHPERIIEETGFDEAVVRRITRLTDLNEHKRHQMPLGLKVSSIAFGRGRRRPLVMGRWMNQ